MQNSALFRLNAKDFLKGLLLAVVTALLGAVYELVKDKGFEFTPQDYQALMELATMVLLGYLSKNLFTNSDNKLAGKL